MKIVISSPELFIKKALTLFLATLILIPLVHYKLLIPAYLYLGGLLILHLFFFYMYFSQVPWRKIAESRKGLSLRLISIAFLIYLLTLLKLEGDALVVTTRIIGVFIIHLMILAFLMVIRVEVKLSQS